MTQLHVVGRTPEQARFDEIRSLLRDAEDLRLRACALLWQAHEAREWAALGLANMTEYVEHLGIPVSTGSKMLTGGRVFACENGSSAWDDLPPADRQELTVDRVYEAGRMVEMGRWTPRQALSEAVAKSAHTIRSEREGVEENTGHTCRCPHCGNEHWAANDA